MPATTGAQPKLCTQCRKDCSTLPRVKDPEGRYTCRPCHDKATGAAPRQRPAAAQTAVPRTEMIENDDWLAASLVSRPQLLAEPCPACSTAIAPGAVVCLGCGYNKATGRRVRTRIEKVKAPKEERASASMGELLTPNMAAVLLILVLGGLYAAAMTNKEMIAFYLLAVILLNLVANIGLVINAAYEGAHRALFCVFVPLYALYYLCTGDVNPYVRVSCVIGLIASFLIFPLGLAMT